jgi:hypothetical protein
MSEMSKCCATKTKCVLHSSYLSASSACRGHESTSAGLKDNDRVAAADVDFSSKAIVLCSLMRSKTHRRNSALFASISYDVDKYIVVSCIVC